MRPAATGDERSLPNTVKTLYTPLDGKQATMGKITEECIRKVKEATDIVELINKYVQLKRAGTAWKGCCPFHAEKTPSFSVNPSRQSFKCFGCGVGGDAIKFIMMYENLDYPEAIRKLADISSIPIVEEQDNPQERRRQKLRSKIIEINNLAADYYHRLLCRSPQAAHVREYLKQRELGIDIAKAWQLGWAPASSDGLQHLAAQKNIAEPLLKEAYLLGTSQSGRTYTIFRDRLMFPIRNMRGETVGFSGRIMQADQDPRKYVNTAETAAFHKSDLLFGLYQARTHIPKNADTAILCEGQIDVIACHEKAGLRHTVAPLGTAFTEEHVHLLRKCGTRRIILCLDGDAAGIKASEKDFRILAAAGMEVYQAALPPGEDPDSLIRRDGADALRTLVEQARPFLEVRLAYEQENTPTDSNARAALAHRMIDLLLCISDPIARDVATADMASRLHIGLEELRTAVSSGAKKAERMKTGRRPAPAADPEETAYRQAPVEIARPLAVHRSIMALCELALCNDRAQELIIDRIEELMEPMRTLPGGSILQSILEASPPPGDEEAWAAFLGTLPAGHALALRDIPVRHIELSRPEHHIQEACAAIARVTLEMQRDAIRARLQDPSVPPDEKLELSRQIVEINRMLIE